VGDLETAPETAWTMAHGKERRESENAKYERNAEGFDDEAHSPASIEKGGRRGELNGELRQKSAVLDEVRPSFASFAWWAVSVFAGRLRRLPSCAGCGPFHVGSPLTSRVLVHCVDSYSSVLALPDWVSRLFFSRSG
jgi:hypothetical protein